MHHSESREGAEPPSHPPFNQEEMRRLLNKVQETAKMSSPSLSAFESPLEEPSLSEPTPLDHLISAIARRTLAR